jgi:hypothetical protein
VSTSVITGNLAEIRTEHFPNLSIYGSTVLLLDFGRYSVS